jgi:hypothetical protein
MLYPRFFLDDDFVQIIKRALIELLFRLKALIASCHIQEYY